METIGHLLEQMDTLINEKRKERKASQSLNEKLSLIKECGELEKQRSRLRMHSFIIEDILNGSLEIEYSPKEDSFSFKKIA